MFVSWLRVCLQGTTQRGSSSALRAQHETNGRVSHTINVIRLSAHCFVTLGVRMCSITDRQNGGDGERGKPDSPFFELFSRPCSATGSGVNAVSTAPGSPREISHGLGASRSGMLRAVRPPRGCSVDQTTGYPSSRFLCLSPQSPIEGDARR